MGKNTEKYHAFLKREEKNQRFLEKKERLTDWVKSNKKIIIISTISFCAVIIMIVLFFCFPAWITNDGIDATQDNLPIASTSQEKAPESSAAATIAGPITEPQYTIDPNKPMIALTFDDGPDENNTEKILATLKKNNSRATFMVKGLNAMANKSILKSIVDADCQLGNHTMWHLELTLQSHEEILEEIESVNEIIFEVTGQECRIVRPPYGLVDDKVKNALSDYPIIMWDVDPEDWRTKAKKSKVIKNVMDNVHDGAIVLMHDVHKQTVEIVEELVPKLLEEGYQLVTIDELFQHHEVELVGGNVYYYSKSG